MFIFSLIAFSFARITQTSYADTTDNQLSLQAQYAAETALNDVRQKLVDIYYRHNIQSQGIPIPLGSNTLYQLPALTTNNFVMQPLEPDNFSGLTSTTPFPEVGLDVTQDRFVVGIGGTHSKVHVFEEENGIWRRQVTIDAPTTDVGGVTITPPEDFGKAVSLHGDTLAIIARDKTVSPECDAVYLYQKSGSSWSQVHKIASPPLLPSNTTHCSLNSLSLHPKRGSTTGELSLVIGSYRDGSRGQPAILYTEQAGAITTWNNLSSDSLFSPHIDGGRGLAVDVVGDILVVGTPTGNVTYHGDFGQVIYYKHNGSNWQYSSSDRLRPPVGPPQTPAEDSNVREFGASVSLYKVEETANRIDYMLIVGNSGYDGQDSGGVALADRGNVYRQQFSYNKTTRALSGHASYNAGNNLLPLQENELGMNDSTKTYNFGKSLALYDRMMLAASNHEIYILLPPHLQDPANRFYQRLANSSVGECLNDSPDLDFDIGDDTSPGNTEQIGYSCVEVDLLPDVILYDNVRSNFPMNAHLDTVDASSSLSTITQENLDDLRIIWSNPDNSLSPPYTFESTSFSAFELPSYTAWQSAGMHVPVLKVQLMPFDQDGFHRLSLLQDMKIFYLYPVKASTARRTGTYDRAETKIDYRTISNGSFHRVNCYSDEGLCDVSIVNMPNVINYTTDDPATPVSEVIPDITPTADRIQTLINIASLYQETGVEVRGYFGDSSNGTFSNPATNFSASSAVATSFLDPLYFKDIQAVVRATGYAGGGRVKVRLEERIPLRPRFELPEHGVQSAETLCKVLVGDQDSGTTTINDYSVYPWQPPDLQTLTDLDAKSNCRVY